MRLLNPACKDKSLWHQTESSNKDRPKKDCHHLRESLSTRGPDCKLPFTAIAAGQAAQGIFKIREADRALNRGRYALKSWLGIAPEPAHWTYILRQLSTGRLVMMKVVAVRLCP